MFPVLHSHDLVHWEQLGGALQPLPGTLRRTGRPKWPRGTGASTSTTRRRAGARDDTHRLRVAVADHPAGPFVDSGRLLLPDEGFTIDAHPFRDPKDGRWYLFFAKDFFDARVGTALAAVPLADDMVSVGRAGHDHPAPLRRLADPRPQPHDLRADTGTPGTRSRARSWSSMKAATTSFTAAGRGTRPTMASATPSPTSCWGLTQEPEAGPAVLRGVPGHVFGPGHNSVVLGPDDRTQFLAYHAWDAAHTARRLCLDPLVWTPDGPRCTPTWTEQTIAGAPGGRSDT